VKSRSEIIVIKQVHSYRTNGLQRGLNHKSLVLITIEVRNLSKVSSDGCLTSNYIGEKITSNKTF
jgi:hypothetical protein